MAPCCLYLRWPNLHRDSPFGRLCVCLQRCWPLCPLLSSVDTEVLVSTLKTIQLYATLPARCSLCPSFPSLSVSSGSCSPLWTHPGSLSFSVTHRQSRVSGGPLSCCPSYFCGELHTYPAIVIVNSHVFSDKYSSVQFCVPPTPRLSTMLGTGWAETQVSRCSSLFQGHGVVGLIGRLMLGNTGEWFGQGWCWTLLEAGQRTGE